MNTENLEKVDLVRIGWVKCVLFIVMLAFAIVFPVVITALLHSFILADPFKNWAIVCGISLMFFFVPFAVWLFLRWGLSLTNAEAGSFVKRRIARPHVLILIPIQLLMVGLVFFMLWNILG